MSGAFDIQEPQHFAPTPAEQQAEQPPPVGDNEAKFSGFLNQVRKLGRDSGQGKEALPNLVVAVVDAINEGALPPRQKFRGEDGKDLDAAHYIVEVYSKEEGRKLAHERTALGKKTQASKINQVIKAARQEKFNFREAIDRAMEVRPQLIAEAGDKKKIKPAFDTYISMARLQIKEKRPVTNDDIIKVAQRSTTYNNDFVKELKRMWSRLNKLLSDGAGDVRISQDEPIYESMGEVAGALEDAIRQYEPNFNMEEPQAVQQAAQ